MAVTDHANAAAVVAAGYTKTQIDRGATAVNNSQNPRFITRFEKPRAKASDAGDLIQVEGSSTVDANTADTNAVAALNAYRRHHVGGSAGRASGSAESLNSRGGTEVVDIT